LFNRGVGQLSAGEGMQLAAGTATLADVSGARLGDDIEGRVELRAAFECDPAARY
jgi:autotransporter translocation and assembly factor TamB